MNKIFNELQNVLCKHEIYIWLQVRIHTKMYPKRNKVSSSEWKCKSFFLLELAGEWFYYTKKAMLRKF